MIMKLSEFLIKAHQSLDAATVAFEIGETTNCMNHLGNLHGLNLLFIESEEINKLETFPEQQKRKAKEKIEGYKPDRTFINGMERSAMKKFRAGCVPENNWAFYRKVHSTQAQRILEPFEVETTEGTLTCQDGYLAIDSRGFPYPIDKEEFETIYEKV